MFSLGQRLENYGNCWLPVLAGILGAGLHLSWPRSRWGAGTGSGRQLLKAGKADLRRGIPHCTLAPDSTACSVLLWWHQALLLSHPQLAF